MTVEQLITDNLALWTSAVTHKKTSGRGSSAKRELTGIKKLRELILELAVRGKLVVQDANDQPATQLMAEIEKERQLMATKWPMKKARKPKVPLEGRARTSSLPRSWELCSLTEVYFSISPSGKKLKSSEISESGIFPVVDQGQSLICGYSDDADLLIEPPRAVVVFGDHTRACKYVDFAFVAGADGTKILCPLVVDPRFFYLQLLSYDLEHRGYARHFKILNAQKFALPPLAEQHRIVQKVDELMALCDQLEQQTGDQIEAHERLVDTLLDTLTRSANATELAENWARVQQHFDTLFTTEHSIDRLKQTILQLAVMGRLVSQVGSDETVEKLLEDIIKATDAYNETNKVRSQKPLPELAEDERWLVPQTWMNVRLDTICVAITSGSTPPKTEFIVEAGIPFLKVYNIRGQKVDFGYKSQFVKEAVHYGRLKKSVIKPGDVLMNIVGPPLGKTAIVPDDFGEWNCNQAIVFFRPALPALSAFIHLFLKSGIYLDRIELIGTAGQDNISVTKSRSIVMPLPPLAEQQRIVARVDELVAMCESLKAKLEGANETSGELARALVDQVDH